MNSEITTTIAGFSLDRSQSRDIVEKVIAENGNLIKLSPVERKVYFLAMCDRYGLDPFSNPFDYMEQKKKVDGQYTVVGITLYPNKKAAEAFGQKYGLTCKIVEKTIEGSTAFVTVEVTNGRRVVQEIGAVEINAFITKGDAIKKALTQARRRGILAFCGFSTDLEEDRAISPAAIDPPDDVLQGGGIPVSVTVLEPQGMDRGPTMAAIDTAIKQLGWSRKTASEYLKTTYGKPTRDELSDAELIDFCEHLEAIVRQTVPAS